MTIPDLIDTHLPAAINLRQRLHRIPELGYEECKTAAAIRGELDRLAIPCVAPGSSPTATVAWLGDTAKPCIALRADIDALPINENTGLPYASTHAGRMHACGHDGHSAALVGAAAVLKSLEKDLPVCVKLIWQPAEEAGGGAEKIIEAGVLDGRLGPAVSAIFALHGWPGLKQGLLATKPGSLLAATDNFNVKFIGRGCHGAYPQFGRDPIPAACEAVLSLQQIVTRELDPTEPAVITVGTINGGSAVNIIPDEVAITGTVRTLEEPTRQRFRDAIQRRCSAIASAAGCTINFDWFEGYPAVNNDPAMADFAARTIQAAFGPSRFIPVARPSMGGEDFSYYLQQIPGCFCLVGVEPPDQTGYPMLHTDRYNFPDEAVETALRLHVELATRFDPSTLLNNNRKA